MLEIRKTVRSLRHFRARLLLVVEGNDSDMCHFILDHRPSALLLEDQYRHPFRSSTMISRRQTYLLLIAISGSTVAADKFGITNKAKAITEKIPDKSWAVVGYESFHGERAPADRKRTARTAAKSPSSPSKKVESSDPASDDAPSGVTKAMVGIGLAAAAAAVGGTVLASQEKPERALVEAVNKPVVAKPIIVMHPKRIRLEGATIASEVLNLVKSIVGVGVLSLPAGVAAFGSAPSAFIPAAILITVIGVLSGYGFSLIGKVCAYTGAKSYREAWSRTVGEQSSWIPAWSTTCKTFLACLAFSMVLADTFSSLFETSRNGTLMTVTLLVLTPLCLMKNLRSLAPFSLLGVLGMTYTALAMTIRWLDGSYSLDGDEPGQLVAELARHLKPKFGELGMESVMSPNALILVCMLSTAYMVRGDERTEPACRDLIQMTSNLILFSFFPRHTSTPRNSTSSFETTQ